MALRRLINSITGSGYKSVSANNSGSNDAAKTDAQKAADAAKFKTFQAKTARDTKGFANLNEDETDAKADSASLPPAAPANPSVQPDANIDRSTFRKLS